MDNSKVIKLIVSARILIWFISLDYYCHEAQMKILKCELNRWLNLVRGRGNKGLTVINATSLHEFGKENLSSKRFFDILLVF